MLRIGSLQLETNLLLAPIAGYCDLAFRTICRELGGVGLACTDLLSPEGLLRGTATSLDLAKTDEFDSPIGMQLYGRDPEIMAAGARWALEHGADLVDINMGCPVDKVTKKDAGSKLLCVPDLAERLVERVRDEIDGRAPLTVKTRLGWTDDQPVAEWLLPRLVRAGAQAVTIHGRSTQQKFTGSASLEGIRRVVDAVKSTHPDTPVIGNGDVTEPEHALRMIRQTGCDGVMIGRGALSTPWIFRDTRAMLAGEPTPPAPDPDEVIGLVERFFGLMLEQRGERYAMHHIRRRITWFAKRLPPPTKPLKHAVREARDPLEVVRVLAEYRAQFTGTVFGPSPIFTAGGDARTCVASPAH